MVSENPENHEYIKYIENPHESVQLLAVKQSKANIQYIKNPTEALQLLAVKGSEANIQYIKKPHPSVKNHPNVIAYRKEQKIAAQRRATQSSSPSSSSSSYNYNQPSAPKCRTVVQTVYRPGLYPQTTQVHETVCD